MCTGCTAYLPIPQNSTVQGIMYSYLGQFVSKYSRYCMEVSVDKSGLQQGLHRRPALDHALHQARPSSAHCDVQSQANV